MTNEQKIDAALARLRGQNNEVDRVLHPQRETRPQPLKERSPDYYNRELEKQGRSEWSGGWGRGR